jgi:hypothetical protein
VHHDLQQVRRLMLHKEQAKKPQLQDAKHRHALSLGAKLESLQITGFHACSGLMGLRLTLPAKTPAMHFAYKKASAA